MLAAALISAGVCGSETADPLVGAEEHSTTGATADLPNGMSFKLPGAVYSSETPYALSLAGGDLQAFAATAASLSSNPALASAVRQQSILRQGLGARITGLERVVAERQRVVAAALYEVQKATRALSLAQRDAYVSRSQLAGAHRQLAALDVNARRLTDTARLADLQRALSLTQSTLSPAAVLTETQRVVNAQLAASLRDQIAQVQARIDAAGSQIDSILGAQVTGAAAERYRAAEGEEQKASAAWAQAQRDRAEADKANTVRAHLLAARAHEAINVAGERALKPKASKPAAAAADKPAAPKSAAKAAAADKPAGEDAPKFAAAAMAEEQGEAEEAAQPEVRPARSLPRFQQVAGAAAGETRARLRRVSSRGSGVGGALRGLAPVAEQEGIGAGAGVAAAVGAAGSDLAGRSAGSGAVASGGAAGAAAGVGATAAHSRHVNSRSSGVAGLASAGGVTSGSAEAASSVALAAAVQGQADAAIASTEALLEGISRETRLHSDALAGGADE